MAKNKIAVLGAGIMGCDLSLDLAIHNYHVQLYDIAESQLELAKTKIEQQCRLYKMLNQNEDVSSDEVLKKIDFTYSLNGIEESEIIVENIVENWEDKKLLYTQLNDVVNRKAIIASNTSCIPITKIASLIRYPENVIGAHFMNPVPFKKFVEVIKGNHTSQETVERTLAFLKTLDKKCVVVNDAPGFVSNRVLMLTINESIRTVEEGIAKAADVDKIFKLGFSHAMGPLATADLIGLDTIMYSLNVLYDELNDSKYKPCGLLVKMVNDGTLGKKSGKGFFNY